ncbi:MAG: BrnA antitoxin family protein [Burkholderiales bacterium]|nr:BrnA antitoxin family protein [Burkholderiales bacterium]
MNAAFAAARHPPAKKPISIKRDEDVLDYFKGQGTRYQAHTNAVLRGMQDLTPFVPLLGLPGFSASDWLRVRLAV